MGISSGCQKRTVEMEASQIRLRICALMDYEICLRYWGSPSFKLRSRTENSPQ